MPTYRPVDPCQQCTW